MFVLLCAVLFMSFEHVSAITPRHIPSKASFWLTILIALPGIGLVSLLSAVWFHYRTKSQLGSQPRSSVGRTGRILLIVLFGLDGLLLLLVLWLAAWSALGSHYRESRVFQVHAIQPPSFMPTPPAMPSLPAMPSAPVIPSDPTPAVAATTPALDALTERIRQELDHAGIRFDQLQVSSPNATQLFASFTSLQARDPANATNDSWHTIVGLLAGTSTSGGGWYFLGQGELGDIHFEIENLDAKQVLAEAGTQATPTPSSKEQLAERLEAAGSITEITLKDKTLAKLATDAATAGVADTVNSALQQMTEYPARDAASQTCALLLAKAGARTAALSLAQGITDLKIHDETLAELAK